MATNATNYDAYFVKGTIAHQKVKALLSAVDAAMEAKANKSTYTAQIAAAQAAADTAVDNFETAIGATS